MLGSRLASSISRSNKRETGAPPADILDSRRATVDRCFDYRIRCAFLIERSSKKNNSRGGALKLSVKVVRIERQRREEEEEEGENKSTMHTGKLALLFRMILRIHRAAKSLEN